MRIVNNRICYPTHNILLNHSTDPFDAAEVIENCHTPTAQSIALEAANIPATFEYPEITFKPHYASEVNERKSHLGLPTQIRVEAFLHNGNYSKLIHCTVHNRADIKDCWDTLYVNNLRVGAIRRKQIETRYNTAYNILVEEFYAAQRAMLDDPATQI